jgi:hypothetical protein
MSPFVEIVMFSRCLGNTEATDRRLTSQEIILSEIRAVGSRARRGLPIEAANHAARPWRDKEQTPVSTCGAERVGHAASLAH